MIVSSFPIPGLFFPNLLYSNGSKKKSKVRKLATRIPTLQFTSRRRLALRSIKQTVSFNRIREAISSVLGKSTVPTSILLPEKEMSVEWNNRDRIQGDQATVEFGKSDEGKEVAVKICNFSSIFQRECSLLQRVYQAPHLVRVDGTGLVKGKPSIAMECARGGDLFGILENAQSRHRQALPLNIVLTLAKQILESLKEVHLRGVVHRDIKPENILYNPETKEFIITDLGSATLYRSSPEQVTGTFSYSSPEFILEIPSDPVQDIWSLGLTLYTAFMGTILFQPARTQYALLKNLQEEFGAIPQWMIRKMSPEKRASCFVLKEGQYVFKEKIRSKTTWEQKIRITEEKNQKSSASIEMFIDLLRKMLSYERPTAQQLLNHPSMKGDVSFTVNIKGKESVSLAMTSEAQNEEGKPLSKISFSLYPNRSVCLHVPQVPGGKYKLKIDNSQKTTIEKVISISQGGRLEVCF